jgi:hypothetical protein
MTRVGRFGVGLVVGGLLAGAVLILGGPGREETASSASAPVTITTVPTAAAVPFFEEGEMVVGSTVLLPRELDVEEGVARLSYDLAGLGPSLTERDDADYQGDGLMMPELWELTTESGVVVEDTTGRFDRSVRFELPSADDVVARIELVGWRVGTVFGDRVELDIAEGETGLLRSGRVTIETVLEQSTSTIVQVDFDRSGGEWGGGEPRPIDGGWRVSGMQGGGIQLIWEGPDVPERVVLEDTDFEMRPVSGRLLVVEAGPTS